MDQISIPSYCIEKEIGHGEMTTVYLAVQESLNPRVALKVMAQAMAAGTGEKMAETGVEESWFCL